MKDKNLLPDNSSQSLEELTKEANNIIESLEGEKDLRNSIDSYQELLKLNNIIEKKFHKTTKIINEETKKKINIITSKKIKIEQLRKETSNN
jgi:exonuclease VII small subunit